MRRISSRTTLFALITWMTLPACVAWRGNPVQPVKYADSIIHYPGDGGVVISNGAVSRKSICVAPPAQGALLRATDTKTGAKVDVVEVVGVGIQADHASSESLARMYEQNERSLFLQYSMYRLCEAYMNGMLTPGSTRDILAMEKAKAVAASTNTAKAVTECKEAQADIQSRIKALDDEKKAELGEDNKQTKRELEAALENLDCEQATTDAELAKKSADYLTKRVAELEADPDKPTDSGLLYWLAFSQILETSVQLAKFDAEASKLRAETEAAVAKKELNDAKDKIKALEGSKTTLEELRKTALDNEITRAKCSGSCDDGKDKKTTATPTTATPTTATSTGSN